MIEARSLTYTYPGAAEPAVKTVGFRIERGEVFGFLGPSGAGKSTTQKILIGLLRDYQGDIAVFGRDLRSWKSDYYERVGVSFEVPNHYLKLTALENLEYFRSLYSGATEDPRHLLERVGLGGEGDKRVSQFSKGMRVRLSFARALLNRPELLFLDEPTSGLDPGTSRRVRDVIRQKRDEGTTVFLTTHNMTIADELCDRVAFLVDGTIQLVDAPRALKLRYGQRTVRVEYGSDGRLQHQDFPLEGLADNPAFLEILRTGPVQTIHTQETTLEDIFLEITGRTLS
ncbi:MAG TPA: ABC transporter ATP-binding protein [Thermoanaerobaculia bacterium]